MKKIVKKQRKKEEQLKIHDENVIKNKKNKNKLNYNSRTKLKFIQ